MKIERTEAGNGAVRVSLKEGHLDSARTKRTVRPKRRRANRAYIEEQLVELNRGDREHA